MAIRMTELQLSKLSNIDLLKLYKSKALVCICSFDDGCNSVNRQGFKTLCGPQQISAKCLREIKNRGIHLPELSIAISEDWSCGRRKNSKSICEFDEIMEEFIKGMTYNE